MKTIKRIISSILWAVIGLYVAVVVLLHLPAVQQYIGNKTAEVISEKLGTKVEVGRVNIGFLNRIIADDIRIEDQQHKPMLSAARVSAKFNILPLSQGRIVITSAQLFGMRAALSQDSPEGDFNFQFALDSLASRDTTSHNPLDLRISSLIIRRGNISFDRNYVPKGETFSTDHIHASDISAHFMLNALKDDSLNVNIKRLSMRESSGLTVKNLKLKLIANNRHATLSDLVLELPESKVNIPTITADYEYENGKVNTASLIFKGNINNTSVKLSELTPFIKSLKDNANSIMLSASLSGNSSDLRLDDVIIHATDGTLDLQADGMLSNSANDKQWFADIKKLHVGTPFIQTIFSALNKPTETPAELIRMGDIDFDGSIGSKGQDKLSAKGLVVTETGRAQVEMEKDGKRISGSMSTDGINIGKILDNKQLGTFVADIDIDGFGSDMQSLKLNSKGFISRLDFNNYTYNNIDFTATFDKGTIDTQIAIDDQNAKLDLWGTIGVAQALKTAKITADITHLKPAALKLTDRWGDADFSFNLTADVEGRQLNTANGNINIGQFQMTTGEDTFGFDNLHLATTNKDGQQHISLESDFAEIDIEGTYDYATLPQSLANVIGSRLPTLPGLPKMQKSAANDFSINATIINSNWLRDMFDIPLSLHQPMTIDGHLNDRQQELTLDLKAPLFTYNETKYQDGLLTIESPNDTLHIRSSLRRISENDEELVLALHADAADNHLKSSLQFANHSHHPMNGKLNADAHFFQTTKGIDAAHVDIHTSEMTIGQTVWEVEPGTIIYSKDDLTVDHLAVKSGNQHLIIDGYAGLSPSDSLIADLQNIDVEYILDLVNFHSVKLSGMATGKAVLKNAFEKPEASAHLTVSDFRFEDGRLGTLTAFAEINNEAKQIDIRAIANDTIAPNPLQPSLASLQPSYVRVNGQVSPWRNDIELFISPQNARGEFLESFCGSFMRDVNVQVTGDLRLYGPLSDVNLTGEAVADGTLGIKPLNTTYTLRNDTIRLIPNEIIFERDTIYDVNEHIAIVNGALHHNSLKHLTYDIGISAQNLLAFDIREFSDDTFCGTVYGTGTCNISGRSGEVNIDINVTPEENSEIRYNASSPDAISSGEFITWRDREEMDLVRGKRLEVRGERLEVRGERSKIDREKEDVNIPVDIRMNFLINATPSATLKVIMDQSTGDYIALNGSGTIRATYYNKGSFDMFGNYNVDDGVYKLTIQNVIKKDFQFQEGSAIAFGGDPFNAVLNLKAQYTVAGVPLSDLNIGRSFTSNNIRVNCLMNIGGTPGQPRVEFDLDMPTVGSDAKQMIFSLINSEEEMNQQVLYLLAVGRFYNQGANNAGESPSQQSQTSLAMQSLLSGTISQQLNNVLSSITKNQNWNFGANISTGDQGFYNAEYEGLLSGRLLDNRLLINGEFGYRDNPNATTSFIGDFDIRYLLRPSGNLAIKVYNQTNDRYFTRNSLNTQGVGLIMKKDFDGLRDLFGIHRKSTVEQKDSVDTSR